MTVLFNKLAWVAMLGVGFASPTSGQVNSVSPKPESTISIQNEDVYCELFKAASGDIPADLMSRRMAVALLEQALAREPQVKELVEQKPYLRDELTSAYARHIAIWIEHSKAVKCKAFAAFAAERISIDDARIGLDFWRSSIGVKISSSIIRHYQFVGPDAEQNTISASVDEVKDTASAEELRQLETYFTGPAAQRLNSVIDAFRSAPHPEDENLVSNEQLQSLQNEMREIVRRAASNP